MNTATQSEELAKSKKRKQKATTQDVQSTETSESTEITTQSAEEEKPPKTKKPRIKSLCECGNVKYFCKVHGNSRCAPPCGKLKHRCSEHGTGKLCPCGYGIHNCKLHSNKTCSCGTLRTLCKEHGGGGLCDCGIPRANCLLHGNRACPCGNFKELCPKHNGNALCSMCKYIRVHKKGNLCSSCATFGTKKSKVKECQVAEFLKEKVTPHYTRWDKQIPGALICGKYRADFTWELIAMDESRTERDYASGAVDDSETPKTKETTSSKKVCRVVILEVDENQHSHYPKGCEFSRMANIVQSYGGLPVSMIRYNPDAFKLNSSAKRSNYTSEMRLSTLGTALKVEFEDKDFAENLFTLQYLFYDNSKGSETAKTYRFKTIEEYAVWMNKILEKEDKPLNKAKEDKEGKMQHD